MGLFNSTWHTHDHHGAPYADGPRWDGTVYPFGVDPMWQKAENKMSFFNSYKMKVSIIFGVAQMSLGISLSYFNCVHSGDTRSIRYGFIPEMTFFLSIFGYLVFMIMRKWSIDWVGEEKRPPSLLNTLIAMFMSPGVYSEEDRLFGGQEYLQLLLMIVAVTAVPCLLIPKPYLFYKDMKAKEAADAELRANAPIEAAVEGGFVTAYRAVGSSDELGASGAAAGAAGVDAGDEGEGASETAEGGEAEEESEFSEVVVHQVIHTIEFVLGSISNTASYLRLWALSLAHSQLSELFWDKVMREQAFPAAKLLFPLNGIAVMLFFSVWVFLNIGVLMVMENLSSFLHALRLQWVEFQNKFYHGDGHKFAPFSYAKLVLLEDD